MNVYLLPHHPLDSRFQYTLEREEPAEVVDAASRLGTDEAPVGWWRRQRLRLRELLKRLKHDYDHVVHGHEQIRISRLVLMLDRDPDLTLVIPAGMTRERSLQAVRGVIKSRQMAHRSHAIRNVLTALVMMVFLFGVIPTHVAAVVFYPLIGLYAWGRYWEDRLINRTFKHLLEVRLAAEIGGRLREEGHLARLEQVFATIAKPDDAYRAAADLLDGLDNKLDGKPPPQHTLMYNYYRDIGRLDPYERYQDRIRKKLIDTVRLVARHLWAFWKGAFVWTFGRTRVAGVRLPNWIFVIALLSIVNLVVWGTLRNLQSKSTGLPGSATPTIGGSND